ncbi:hypothetical protein D3C84_639020 [compost metagenome]
MADGRDNFAAVPGPLHRTLDVRIVGNIHHRAQAAREEDRVVVQDIHLRQLAAVGHAPDRRAVAECPLRWIAFVVTVFRRRAAQWRRVFHRHACFGEHLIRVSDLREKVPGATLVRADFGGVGQDEQDVFDAHDEFLELNRLQWIWRIPLDGLTLPHAQIFEKFTYLILDIHRAL